MGNSQCMQGFGDGIKKPKVITLKYFQIAGRAEPIRLALTIGRLKYYDQRIEGNDWEPKYKKQTPYGQLPVLIVDQKVLAQTKAILRYIGKLATYEGKPLYPRDPLVAAKVDELMEVFDDLWLLLAPTFKIPDQRKKELYRIKLFEKGGEAASMVDNLERCLGESQNGYVVPQARGLTIADLMYFTFLNFIRSGFVEGLGTNLFASWPRLREHKEKIAKLPPIKQYYVQNSSTSNPADSPFYQVFKPGH